MRSSFEMLRQVEITIMSGIIIWIHTLTAPERFVLSLIIQSTQVFHTLCENGLELKMDFLNFHSIEILNETACGNRIPRDLENDRSQNKPIYDFNLSFYSITSELLLSSPWKINSNFLQLLNTISIENIWWMEWTEQSKSILPIFSVSKNNVLHFNYFASSIAAIVALKF